MAEERSRPDPDALLRRIQEEEERTKRTKLKLFFGFAPGVGKTYAMLESARRLAAQGVNVVVGYVETHGRSETAALLEGLEQLPRREIEYRGHVLEEFDLEAALTRKPQVLLVDELAHTNVPGALHAKRWQDVAELLEAGIEVHTTLNVQHVESLNDVVAQITGVTVRETVPDAVLDRVDEIELCDLPPDELLQRLQEGKVYVPSQARRATERFFQRGNLLALRELSLRRTAERVDAEVRAHREQHQIAVTWAAGERILVCVGPSPASAGLARAARRIAASLHAPWVALSIDLTTGPPISSEDRARLEQNLRLAESLGASVAQVSGNRISDAVIDYARKHNVNLIIIGKPIHPRWRDLLGGSVVDDVVRASGKDIDVHVITGEPAAGDAVVERARRRTQPYRSYLWAAIVVAVTTAIGVALRNVLLLPDVVVMYLATIMVIAVRLERGPAVAASVLSVAGYNFFFIPPFHTFTVHDLRHVLTFAAMLVTGVLISGLTARIRGHEIAARAREERTGALFELSRDLVGAAGETEVARVAAARVVESFEGAAAVFVSREGELVELGREGELGLGMREIAAVKWVIEHGRPAGFGTDTLPGAEVHCLPIVTPASVLGVLALSPSLASALSGDQRAFLGAFVRQLAMALARARLSDEARAAALKAKTEEMRSTLLSAVSHDLRTPLAAITGAATAIRDEPALTGETRADLIETICEEAERLERLVGNLLDMTRLESGGLQPKKDWVPLEEVVGAALSRLESRLSDRPIRVTIPDEIPLVSVDPVLLEQVFVNLLDNAAKYTPKASPVEVEATTGDSEIVVELRDRGPGVARGSESRVFDKFFREGGAGGGVGLGLAICKGILEVHGGSIEVERREGGGATFRLRLPIGGAPPEVAEAPETARPTEAPYDAEGVRKG